MWYEIYRHFTYVIYIFLPEKMFPALFLHLYLSNLNIVLKWNKKLYFESYMIF